MKKILKLSLLPTVVFSGITVVACNNTNDDKKQNTSSTEDKIKNVEANAYGLGYYPSTIKKELENKTNKELIDKINYFIKSPIDYDSEAQYSLDLSKSSFNNQTDLEHSVEVKIALVLTKNNSSSTTIYNIKDVNKNNIYDAGHHEVVVQDQQVFWDGQLIISGNATKEAASEVDLEDLVSKLKKCETFQEQINLLTKYVDIEFKPNSDYSYASSDATHAHEDEHELHYTFKRINNKTKQEQLISSVIKNIGKDSEDQKEHVVGDLIFTSNLTDLGKKTPVKQIFDELKGSSNKANDMIEILRKYVEIKGTIDKNKYTYAFDMNPGKTHIHEDENELHLFIQFTDVKSNKAVDKNFEIQGFGSQK